MGGASGASAESGPLRAFGKYQLVAKLGSGGMADVFLAVSRGAMGFNKLVVLKRLRTPASDIPTVLQMFLDEARLAARLTHHNIVQTYEVGERDGTYFIAMEYLEGQPLNKVAREAGAARFTRAMWCRVMAEALTGLHYAHELRDYDGTPVGLVHRDISPHNVFVTYSGEVKVVDFGIAKAAVNNATTETGVLKGKIGYMAPEQAQGEAVDRRTDLFATGIVLWELITGRKLYEGEGVKVLNDLVNKPVPRLASVLDDVDPELDAIVAKAVEKDPSARFRTAEEMHDALEAYIRRSGDVVSEALIGRAVTEMFADVKESVAKQILLHMSNADAATSSSQLAVLALGSNPQLADMGPSASSSQLMVRGDATRVEPGGPGATKAKWRGRWALAAALAVTGGVVGIALATRLGSPPRDATDTSASTVAGPGPSASAAPAAVAPCDGSIKVRILADFTGGTKEVCTPYTQAEIDYLRELDEAGGIGGCKVDVEVADYGYDIGRAQAIYDRWKASPDWPDVVAIFGFGSGDTLKLAPQVKADKKPLISASYSGALASPLAVDLKVDVPELGPTFEENTFPSHFTTEGYPYNFFAGTDYATGARIAMFHVKTLGGKRVGFFHCDQPYCTTPIPAARSYAKQLGLALGRDLVLQLGEDQATYDKKVTRYFEEEVLRRKADPKYTPVDWVWFGNTSRTTTFTAKALARVNKKLGLDVHAIVDNWGFDELLYAQCGAACVDRIHGIMPFAAYGDASGGATEMPRVTALQDKWKKIDDATGTPRAAHKNVHYVQGYVSAMIFKIAVERVIAQGKRVTGENVKAALETFRAVDTGGLTDTLSFTATDHRPQSSESIYKIDDKGALVLEPPKRTIALEESWLGW